MVAQKIDLHEYIENLPVSAVENISSSVQFVDWKDMPPEVYRNVQRDDQWEAYKKHQAKRYNNVVDSQHDEYRQAHKSSESEYGPGNIIPQFRKTLTADAQRFMKEVGDQEFVEIFEDPLYNQPSVDNSFI